MIKISIILAVYNEDRYLSKCIASLLSQGEKNFEIIIVDDGSVNPVKLPVNNGKTAIPIHLFHIPHGGTAVARNYGVSKAKGKIIVFIDGDMEFEPDFLKDLTQPVQTGKARGTFSTQEYVANWDKAIARCWNYEHGLSNNKRIDELKINMVRDFRGIMKSEFTRVKGFDDIGYTDTWSLAEKLGYTPLPTQAVYYHYNPESYREVYSQAKWIGGRKRRFGTWGQVLALIRATWPFSVVYGLRMASKYRLLAAFPFKMVYDWGIFIGILSGSRKK